MLVIQFKPQPPTLIIDAHIALSARHISYLYHWIKGLLIIAGLSGWF